MKLLSQTFLLDQITPIEIYSKLRDYFEYEISILFESGEDGDSSFIAIGVEERLQYINRETILSQNNHSQKLNISPIEYLKNRFKNIDQNIYREHSRELKVGFIDGFIGYVGYEAIAIFEPVLNPYLNNLVDEIGIPDIDLIRPKLIVSYSHRTNRATIITYNENIKTDFYNIELVLRSPTITKPILKAYSKNNGHFKHSKADFFKMIDESKKMIRSGDVFQILISNRYYENFDEVDPFSFYRLLRSKNPSPYMFFMDYKDFVLAGSSPEVMIKLTDGEILLRPIAGTRKRGRDLKRDRELENELLNDPKELAEHLMLIDLGRNDIGRVAKVGSISVPNMMRIERYSHVMHMVSDITGELNSDKYDMFDLLKATFTAGTMTGAPKIRAMELIATYESIKRNFYSGTIGYFSFDGNMDSTITIRTALFKDQMLFLQAGAGIVADSKNELELIEVRNKMGALLSTIEDLKNL